MNPVLRGVKIVEQGTFITGPCAGMATKAKLPSRLHHTAYVSKDLEATRKFYEEIIGLPLLATWCEKDMEAVLRIRREQFRANARNGGPGGGPAQPKGMQLGAAYQILEVDPKASFEEVSKAYRRQLSKHHPDKLKANGLPDSMLEHAKQRTQQIIEAYELIKERRGIA